MRFEGNVCVWREILEFVEKFCLFVLRNTCITNCGIIGQLSRKQTCFLALVAGVVKAQALSKWANVMHIHTPRQKTINCQELLHASLVFYFHCNPTWMMQLDTSHSLQWHSTKWKRKTKANLHLDAHPATENLIAIVHCCRGVVQYLCLSDLQYNCCNRRVPCTGLYSARSTNDPLNYLALLWNLAFLLYFWLANHVTQT